MICSLWCWQLVWTGPFSSVQMWRAVLAPLATVSLHAAAHVTIFAKKNAELAALSFRSEVSKLQLPGSTSAEQQLSVSSRPGQRCCLDTQHDRCSPTGCAVTTPDKSKTILNIKVQNVFSDTSHSCMSFNASLSKINTELAGKVILTPFWSGHHIH